MHRIHLMGKITTPPMTGISVEGAVMWPRLITWLWTAPMLNMVFLETTRHSQSPKENVSCGAGLSHRLLKINVLSRLWRRSDQDCASKFDIIVFGVLAIFARYHTKSAQQIKKLRRLMTWCKAIRSNKSAPKETCAIDRLILFASNDVIICVATMEPQSPRLLESWNQICGQIWSWRKARGHKKNQCGGQLGGCEGRLCVRGRESPICDSTVPPVTSHQWWAIRTP